MAQVDDAGKAFRTEIHKASEKKMSKEFVWEVQAMEEIEPFHVTTGTDSVLEAARRFEEDWGRLSVRYIRKKAITKKISYEGYEPEDWQVS